MSWNLQGAAALQHHIWGILILLGADLAVGDTIFIVDINVLQERAQQTPSKWSLPAASAGFCLI